MAHTFSKTFRYFTISWNHFYQIWQLVIFSWVMNQNILTSELFKLHFHIKICTYLYILRHLTDHQIWWPHYSIFNSSCTVLRVWSHSISHHVKGAFNNNVDKKRYLGRWSVGSPRLTTYHPRVDNFGHFTYYLPFFVGSM